MIRSALMNVMTAAALKAGRGLKRDFGEVENLQVSVKGPGDFVSAADRKAVTNPDSGSATEELDVEYDSSPIDIGFNARYLLDITEQLDGDTVLFKLADPGSPTLVQDRDGAAALYVLMPMRV